MPGRRRLESEAKAGNADAQYSLAAAYATGEGFSLDLSQALDWYSRAANQGHPEALYNLGLMYLRGEGAEKDRKKGIEFLLRAAKLESKDAMEFVADSLVGGHIIAENHGALAAYYYLRGIDAGNIHSPVSLAVSIKSNKIGSEDIISALLHLAIHRGSKSAKELLNSSKYRENAIIEI